MGFIDDLGKANAILASGSKELEATQNQIKNARLMEAANTEARNIRNSEQKDSDKRAAFGKLADELTFSLAETGDPAMIQNILNRFSSKPPLLQTAEQAILQGAEDPAQAGQDILKDQRQHQLDLLGAREQASVRAEQRKEGKLTRPTRDTIKRVQESDSQAVSALSLLDDIKNDPGLTAPIAGRIPGATTVMAAFSGDFAKFESKVGRFFDAYRKYVTGAQAGKEEIAFLEERVPKITDTPTQFIAKLEGFQRGLARVREQQLNNAEAGGEDVSRLRKTSPFKGISPVTTEELIKGVDLDGRVKAKETEVFRKSATAISQQSLSSDRIKPFIRPLD